MAGQVGSEERLVLTDVLDKNGISVTWFRIGGYREDCRCLEEVDGEFQVYTAFRNNKENLTCYQQKDDAIKAFIRSLTYDEVKTQKIYDEFVDALERDE